MEGTEGRKEGRTNGQTPGRNGRNITGGRKEGAPERKKRRIGLSQGAGADTYDGRKEGRKVKMKVKKERKRKKGK
jgi:hypothetical protein